MHTYFHTTFGFCLWDALSLLVLAVIVIALVGSILQARKSRRELEEKLKQQQAEKAVADRPR